MSVTDIRERMTGRRCAWRGCNKVTNGELPRAWVNLITWWSPWPQPTSTFAAIASSKYCQRDAVLCPEHADELEAMLADIPDDEASAGRLQ